MTPQRPSLSGPARCPVEGVECACVVAESEQPRPSGFWTDFSKFGDAGVAEAARPLASEAQPAPEETLRSRPSAEQVGTQSGPRPARQALFPEPPSDSSSSLTAACFRAGERVSHDSFGSSRGSQDRNDHRSETPWSPRPPADKQERNVAGEHCPSPLPARRTGGPCELASRPVSPAPRVAPLLAPRAGAHRRLAGVSAGQGAGHRVPRTRQ